MLRIYVRVSRTALILGDVVVFFQDIYSLNEAFGSEADLKDLISKDKAKDMGIMVDVVSTDHPREEKRLLKTP